MSKVMKFYPGKTFFTSDGWKLRQWKVHPDGSLIEIETDKDVEE